MQQQVAMRTNRMLIAELGGAVVAGFILCSRVGSAGFITKLAVGSAFRQRGIGSALMRRGIEELERPSRRSGASSMMLHVDPSRNSARRLYESFGFRELNFLPNYYSDNRDALLMRRHGMSQQG